MRWTGYILLMGLITGVCFSQQIQRPTLDPNAPIMPPPNLPIPPDANLPGIPEPNIPVMPEPNTPPSPPPSPNPRGQFFEELLGSGPAAIASLMVSADGRHVLYLGATGSSYQVFLDGRPGPVFPGLAPSILTLSSNGTRQAYVVRTAAGAAAVIDDAVGPYYDDIVSLVLSPDGSQVAYIARQGNQYFAVVNGVQQQSFPSIIPTSLRFSDDGSRVGYLAGVAGGMAAVIDGVQGRPYSSISDEGIIFSPFGERYAYAARNNAVWVVVVDGQQGGLGFSSIQNRSLSFSADGRRVAYIGQSANGKQVVIDGIAGPVYDEVAVGGTAFSPDGAHTAYAGLTGGKWVIVLDGQVGGPYDQVGYFAFSPEGRLVVEVRVDNTWTVIDNGEPGPGFEVVYRPVFSALGDHVAYVGMAGGVTELVVDGVPQAASLGISVDSVKFSNDGRHIAYAAFDSTGRKTIVVDGMAALSSDWITNTSPQFSSDGRHVATGVLNVGEATVAVDDQLGPPYDSIVSGPVAEGRGFIAIGLRSGDFYRLTWVPPRGPVQFSENSISTSQ
jgi:hypothetical protein